VGVTADLEAPAEGIAVTVFGAALVGNFRGTGISDATASGLADLRPLSRVVFGDPDQMCANAGGLCEPCPSDGSESCLAVSWSGVDAAGSTLVVDPIGVDDVAADPTCP
jgi:hypothetical protein